MWKHLAAELPAPTTLILSGSEVAARFPQFGSFDPKTEVCTYRQHNEVSDAGVVKQRIDVYMLSQFRRDVIAAIPCSTGVLIVSFDWQDRGNWSAQAAALCDLREQHAQLKFVVTSHNHAEFNALSNETDFCHQFLRVVALKLSGTLAYPLEDIRSESWKQILERALGTSHDAPPQNFVLEEPIVIYTDSKEKILTLNRAFDFDAAWDSNRLGVTINPKPVSTNDLSLPALLNEVTKSNTPEVRKVISENNELRMMSDFFTSLLRTNEVPVTGESI